MHQIYLLLGGNIGDRLQWLQKGLEALRRVCGPLPALSPVYETAAWGLEAQPSFLNMVARLETDLLPEDLLLAVQGIEASLDRQRAEKWGARTLDIDILFYDSLILDLPHLQLPHPHIAERRFTLAPLADLAPDLIHPVTGHTVRYLLDHCADPLPVHLYEPAAVKPE